MLKIRYTSYPSKFNLIDVEEYVSSCIKTDDIELWLENQIPTISFDGYDFPYDEVYSYEQYFKSNDEYLDALRIKNVLNCCGIDSSTIQIDILIVNDILEEVENLHQL